MMKEDEARGVPFGPLLGCFQKEESPRTRRLVPILLVLGASTSRIVKRDAD